MAYVVRAIVFEVFEVLMTEGSEWCDQCALPSAYRVHLATQVKGGPLRLSTGTRCGGCERWL